MTSLAPTARRWAPPWARAAAVVGLLSLAVVGGFAAWAVIEDLSSTTDKFDGLVAGLGAVAIGIVLVMAVPSVIFLRRGGRPSFVLGLVGAGLPWLWLLWMGWL